MCVYRGRDGRITREGITRKRIRIRRRGIVRERAARLISNYRGTVSPLIGREFILHARHRMIMRSPMTRQSGAARSGRGIIERNWLRLMTDVPAHGFPGERRRVREATARRRVRRKGQGGRRGCYTERSADRRQEPGRTGGGL